MDNEKMTNAIEGLVGKAVAGGDANDALKFSQAALNTANALATLATVEQALA